MIIKKIIKLKNNKYKIVFKDIELITYDNVIVKNNIIYKKDISEKLYKKIIEDTKYYDIYNNVLKYITRKKRCEYEISTYIDKLTNDINIKDNIISDLKKINLINDYSFASSYINDRLYLSKDGLNKIRDDLLKLNIDSKIVNELIDNCEYNNDKLEKLIIKKINSNSKYSNTYLRQKLINDFTYLGYNKEDIITVIDSNLNEDDEILNKEYNILYNKYKRLYSQNELNNVIIKKLISKGFSYEKVKSIIKETEDY